MIVSQVHILKRKIIELGRLNEAILNYGLVKTTESNAFILFYWKMS